MVVSIQPRGTAYIRSLIARAVGGDTPDAVEYAMRRWGSIAAEFTKDAIAAGGIGSGAWGEVLATPEAQEFWGVVEQASIIGRLPGRRDVQLNIRTQLIDTGANAYWVGDRNPKPLSRMTLQGGSLAPLKVASLVVRTDESVRLTTAQAEAGLRADMIRALAEALDASLIDASNGGVAGERPAAVTYDLAPLSSAGTPVADIETLVAAFPGDLSSSAVVTDPLTATQIALARDSGGAFLFPDVGPRGGTLLGLPLIVSRSSPRTSSGGQLALIDGSGIAYGAEGVRAVVSREASLEMADDPEGAAEQVSLWQTNSVAFLFEQSVNWLAVRPCVSVVTGCDYSGG